MGTDRVEVHSGPCLCGAGRFRVDECEPDHAWVKPGQVWWEEHIDCDSCAKVYTLMGHTGSFSVLLKKELQAKELKRNEWHAKTTEMEVCAERQGYYQRITDWLDSLPSKAAIHRAVQPFLGITGVGTYSTFLRHFRGNTKDWVKGNFRGATLIKALKAVLQIQDARLDSLNEEAERLWTESSRGPKRIKTIKYSLNRTATR